MAWGSGVSTITGTPAMPTASRRVWCMLWDGRSFRMRTINICSLFRKLLWKTGVGYQTQAWNRRCQGSWGSGLRITKLALALGAAGFTLQARALEMSGVQALVIGEAREWEPSNTSRTR